MNIRQTWEERYSEAWPRLTGRIAAARGVAVGFHSVVDGLQRAKPEWLASLLADKALMAEVERRAGEVPAALETPADLVLCLMESMRAGKALQRMIRSEKLYDWMLAYVGYERPRLGGTSGNMANSLAPLGLPVLVYAYPFSRQLLDLFVAQPNLTVLVEEGGTFRTVPPGQVQAPEELKALHLIIEYPQGLSVRYGGTEFTTPRANRFIAGWNPVNQKLRIDDSFRRGFLARAGEFGHFILSGFHILAETYPDGTTYRDSLAGVADFARQAKAANPALRLHCEFASIGSQAVRRGILEQVLPAVDSLGLNEVELPSLLETIGEERLAERLREEESPVAFLEGARLVLERGGLARLHFHNLGYYFVLSRPGYAEPEATRESLLHTAVVAAARTALGRTGSPGEMSAGLAHPLAEAGFAALEAFAAFLKDPAFPESGLGQYAGLNLACVPTRLVAEPKLTVGLGDLISSTAFVLDGPSLPTFLEREG